MEKIAFNHSRTLQTNERDKPNLLIITLKIDMNSKIMSETSTHA